jgi:hypothetical protein
VGDVDQDVERREGRDQTAAHDQDAANVANDIGVFLGRSGSQQTLATGATGPRGLSGSSPVASAGLAGLCRTLLGNDLGLELGGSGFLGLRERAGGTGRGACLGSGGGVSVGTPLARTVRSTSALGHVR